MFSQVITDRVVPVHLNLPPLNRVQSGRKSSIDDKNRPEAKPLTCENVGLTLAYSNPNPQLDGLLGRLSGRLPARGPETGPSALNSPDEQPAVAYPPAPPRALGKRLSPTDRAALTAAFNAGATQQHLATKYGISIRSVKRLVHGNSNRPQATANRLTPDQRDTIIRTYITTGETQAQLARDYGVDISTIKRILREARNTEPGDTFT